MKTSLLAILLLLGANQPVTLTPTIPAGPGMPAVANGPAQQATRRFSQEPTVQDLMHKAATISRVTTKHIEALNRASRLRAILPTASVQYGYGWHETTGVLRDGLLGMDSNSKEAYGGWGIIVGGSWDLPSLVFNPAELQTYSIHGMRNNIQKEISKTYFARRQAILQYLSLPENDEMARLTMQQRIQEYEAILDGLTNDYFSQEMQRRGVEPL